MPDGDACRGPLGLGAPPALVVPMRAIEIETWEMMFQSEKVCFYFVLALKTHNNHK